MEEAVSQYYDNPKKYAGGPAVVDKKLDKGAGIGAQNALPDYQGVASSQPPPNYHRFGNTQQFPGHTNAVIEAGNLRARDEVSLKFGRWQLLTSAATNATHAARRAAEV